MVDTDTFVTALYVMVDDFCRFELPLEMEPGRKLPSACQLSPVRVSSLFGHRGPPFGSAEGRLQVEKRQTEHAFLDHLASSIGSSHGATWALKLMPVITTMWA